MSSVACPLCSVTVPSNGWIQHERGDKHQRLRFYGPGASRKRKVGRVPLLNIGPDGSKVPQSSWRPHEIPDAAVARARRARELVTDDPRLIVAHSGMDLYENILARFSAEAVCADAWLLERQWMLPVHELDAGGGRFLLKHAAEGGPSLRLADGVATPDMLLCAAERLVAPRRREPGSHRPPWLHSLEVRLAAPPGVWPGGGHDSSQIESWRQIELSIALAGVAAALARCADGQRVELHLSGELATRRRLLVLVVNALDRALSTAPWLAELTISSEAPPGAPSGDLREEEVERLRLAATSGWRARALLVLAGGREPRSPLSALSRELIWHILGFIGHRTRLRIGVAPTPPLQHAPAATAHHAGADLGQIAMLIG